MDLDSRHKWKNAKDGYEVRMPFDNLSPQFFFAKNKCLSHHTQHQDL